MTFRGLVALAAGLVSAGAALADGWLPVRSEADGFAVELPGVATLETDTHWTLAGPVRSQTWAANGADDYWVSVHRLPVLARAFISEEGLLARAGRDMVADQGGTDLGAAPARLAGHPARGVTWRGAGGRTGTARLVLTGDRLFVVGALRTGNGPGLERFFGSFELR
ncbi:MAG: hypothetical protein QF890_03680 [Myxococcota bacterium]|nr:hypothetical protein [Deltaproteobacteria bacterium]MCP4239216.1 hypothetical protein [bacterium]MDP6075924.1 hypothetical protein [Myxococcota bacterium]MDP6242310.1 hypothetical protein [Myxococcota bacterium]MDP7076431.1 hypothetical protein [Myxococcota bacterium]